MKGYLIGFVLGFILGGGAGGYVAYAYLGKALAKAQAALAVLKG